MRGRANVMRRTRVGMEKECILDLGMGELWNWKMIIGGDSEEVCCGGLDGCVCVERRGRMCRY